MSINQINPELNDAFQTYYPPMSFIRLVLFKVLTKCIIIGIKMRLSLFGGNLMVNERIVEYPIVFKWLTSDKKSRILDIGCCSSRLPIQLASLGYDIHGLDVQNYNFSHPNFHFYRADMFKWSPEEKFDTIISISVIEHFGIGGYGDLKVTDGDIKAVQRMSEFLKPGGNLIVSMPFGKAAITPKHRIYDFDRLKLLFNTFEFISEKYYKRTGKDWDVSTREALSSVNSLEMPVSGVVVLNLKLKDL